MLIIYTLDCLSSYFISILRCPCLGAAVLSVDDKTSGTEVLQCRIAFKPELMR